MTAQGDIEMYPNSANADQLLLSWHELSVKGTRKVKTDNKFLRILNCGQCASTEEIKILDGVSGRVEGGSLVAVLGASGSGKTTLLATISKRMTGNIDGSILLNGNDVDRSVLVRLSGFVPQCELAINTLTAMEHMEFMSHMKMDKSVKSQFRRQWLESLLSELGLSGTENTMLSAMSGGERKRLSIAAELLTDVPILFCDEPTTGLDSYNALLVIEQLEKLTKRGKLVMCSIHQPASEVISAFHKVILLCGGCIAYHGQIGEALEYFSSLGHPCPTSYNPAEFLVMKLSSVPGEEEASLSTCQELCDAFAKSQIGVRLKNHPGSKEGLKELEKYPLIQSSHWFVKLRWLVWRCFIDMKRNQPGHWQQIFVFLVTSFLLAVFYMHIAPNTQQGIQDVHGLLYLISAEVYFTSAYRVLNTFPQEIAVFLRESDLYPVSAYYVCKVIGMMPSLLIEPAMFLAIICIGQSISGSQAVSYFTVLGPVLLSACSAAAYGCMLSALFESPDTASVIAVPLDLISLLMAGIFYNMRSLPALIQWLKYIAQLHYTNEILSVLHWQTVTHIDCPEDPTLPCLRNGTQVLNSQGFSPQNVQVDIMALVLLFLVLNFVGYLAVYRRSKRRGIY